MMAGGAVKFTAEQKDQFRRRKEEIESLRPTNRAPPVVPGKIVKMLVWDFWEFGRPSGARVLSKRCDRQGLRCGPVVSWEHGWD